MSNKALGLINFTCIFIPMLLGIMEALTGKPMGNGPLVGIVGIFMIIFGIWASIRLIKINSY